MAFSREEQEKDGVTVKQVPALFSSHLRVLVVPMRARACAVRKTLYERVLLAQDIAMNGTIIDISTILLTMYYSVYVLL